MARKSKEELEKEKKAKELVDEVFGGLISVDPKNLATVATKIESLGDVKETKKSTGSVKWLEDQVKSLTDECEELKDKLAGKTEEYKKLFDSYSKLKDREPAAVVKQLSESETQAKVKRIFNDLKDNYEGKNARKAKYTEAKIKFLLETFLKSFPFLHPTKKPVRA